MKLFVFYFFNLFYVFREQNNGAQIIEMLKCNNSFDVECLKKESESLLPEDGKKENLSICTFRRDI